MEESDERFLGLMMPRLLEDDRRFFLAAFAEYKGYGSATEISDITGVSQRTISNTKKELDTAPCDPKARTRADERKRVRAPGAGRKSAIETDPGIIDALNRRIDPYSLGDPMGPLRWTTKSTRKLEEELAEDGYTISHKTIAGILSYLGYSLQQNKKYTESGNPGPDRDEQFRFIASESERFISHGLPVISVDAKKKELVGNFKNGGQEYRPKGSPREVNDHDFGKDHAIPYGIYDITNNEGFVSVGISADTAEFAVNSIGSWWFLMGQYAFPDVKDVMITADGGGSNGARVRLWKAELQSLSDMTGLTFHVRHFPPGTSKWNKIEHRLFSFISMNWKAIPLETYQIIVDLIGSTTNKSGLEVKCILDEWHYETGRRVSDEEYMSINIKRSEWRGDWNYSISPRP